MSEGKERGMFVEIMRYTFIALIIVVPFRIFVAQPFIVSGVSMVPTFHQRDYLVVDQITYRFHPPERGDVVVFRYPFDPTVYFVKRIIGLPGETVRVERGVVTIQPPNVEQSFRLDEPYISSLSQESDVITLEDDEYYVMGDNRNESSDSRVWGPLNEKYIDGRALFRLLPLDSFTFLPGVHRY